MQIQTWNIRHGGGTRTPGICSHLTTHSPRLTTLILTEFRTGPTGIQIRAALTQAGLHHQAVAPTTAPTQNTVLVASKLPFKAQTFPELGPDQQRCLRTDFDDLTLHALYFAINNQKLPLFDFLTTLDPHILDSKALLIGDFNTGLNGPDNEGVNFTAADRFQRLLDLGWIDTWRSRHPEQREFSWYSQRAGQPLNGFRIDHALATPSLDAEISGVRYLHDLRVDGLSDHSAMVVEI